MPTKQPKQTSILNHLGNLISHPQVRAVALIFLAHGFIISSWFAQVPAVKTRLGLNDSELGNVLLGLPLGVFFMNIVAGWFLKKLGAWKSIALGYLGFAISTIFLFIANNYWGLFLNLILAGWTIGILIVAMNTLAARIEKTEGIVVMSSCHAGFSFGAMVGAVISSFVIAKGFLPLHQIIIICVIFFILIFSHKNQYQSIPSEVNKKEEKTFGWPNRELLLLIGVGLAFIFTEGMVVDWSAVYIRDVLGSSPETAALGYSACAFAMMLTRLGGDLLLPRFGRKKILFSSSILSSLGVLIIVLGQSPLVGILGFAIIGVGIALGIPILMSLASRAKGFSDGAGIGIFATFAFIGFIIEPPLVGWIAEQINLRWGLGVIGAISFLGAFLGMKIKDNG